MRAEESVVQNPEASRERPHTGPTPTRNYPRRMPIGAEVMLEGGAHFRVWAPNQTLVTVEFEGGGADAKTLPPAAELEGAGGGYFEGYVAEAAPGMLYRLRIKEGAVPDPASRFQPQGPHGPSQIVDPNTFRWTDAAWKGVRRQGQVIYEMHIGAYTGAGTWNAALEQLPALKHLGVTVLELMPVSDFPGRFGWGYDGVDMFAPTRLYGQPDEFRAFVNRAHELGLGVILDVVYNHVGPDGDYLKYFSRDYYTDRYKNEWGEAINFDGPNSGPVREFFSANAAYWIDEFHLDGLRLDATQQIFDSSPEHILAVITQKVRHAAAGRSTWIVSENERQQARLARPISQGGYGLDALWNDDFHHASRVAATGHNEAYYSDYRGSAQEFVSAAKHGFLYQGQRSAWQSNPRGHPCLDLAPEQFVHYLENHDQVANSLRGQHVHQLAGPGRCKALTALLLLGPATPMLFQGQEFWCSSPFFYFADHNAELAPQVRQGRRDFLSQFSNIACAESDPYLANPESIETFARCKLDHSERQQHAEIYEFYRSLLRLRREDPVFARPRRGGVDGAVIGPEAFVLRFFGERHDDRLLLVNLGMDLRLPCSPEPLLAPVEGLGWQLKWSSEHPAHGGTGTPPFEKDGGWLILGHAALVLEPKRT